MPRKHGHFILKLRPAPSVAEWSKHPEVWIGDPCYLFSDALWDEFLKTFRVPQTWLSLTPFDGDAFHEKMQNSTPYPVFCWTPRTGRQNYLLSTASEFRGFAPCDSDALCIIPTGAFKGMKGLSLASGVTVPNAHPLPRFSIPSGKLIWGGYGLEYR